MHNSHIPSHWTILKFFFTNIFVHIRCNFYINSHSERQNFYSTLLMCSLNILCASLFTQAFSPRLQLHALYLPVFTLLRKNSLSTHVFSFPFVWVIYSARYGLLTVPRSSYFHTRTWRSQKRKKKVCEQYNYYSIFVFVSMYILILLRDIL